jgi:hypothetical protein
MNNTRKRTLAWIAALAATNFLAAELYGLALFNVARVVLAISGGWYLVARNDSGLGFSMLAGLVVFVTDHLANHTDIYGRLHGVKPGLRLFRFVRAERVCLPVFGSSRFRIVAMKMGLLTYIRAFYGALFWLRPNMSFEMTPGPIHPLGFSPLSTFRLSQGR